MEYSIEKPQLFDADVNKLYKKLHRLYYYTDFPAGSQLLCPIFTQNKFEYLAPLRRKKVTDPTIKNCVHKDLKEFYHE
jgi:hypothetical protein